MPFKTNSNVVLANCNWSRISRIPLEGGFSAVVFFPLDLCQVLLQRMQYQSVFLQYSSVQLIEMAVT